MGRGSDLPTVPRLDLAGGLMLPQYLTNLEERGGACSGIQWKTLLSWVAGNRGQHSHHPGLRRLFSSGCGNTLLLWCHSELLRGSQVQAQSAPLFCGTGQCPQEDSPENFLSKRKREVESPCATGTPVPPCLLASRSSFICQ